MPARGSGSLRALDAVPGAAFLDEVEDAWAGGDAVLPMDPAATSAEAFWVLEAARIDLPVEAGDALVITTSGSTARKKAVVLGHRALAASADATRERIGVDANDRWLSCLPWHHIAGLQVGLRARRWQVPLVVHDRFDVERVRAERAATLVSLVPTQLARLLDAGVDLSGFRVVLLGGAPPSPSLLDRARGAGAPVVVTYGMTETCGGCVYDGVPLETVDVELETDGRIRLRGPMLMSGYRVDWDGTSAMTDDGCFRTSDLGRWVDGRLVVDGRIDDVINTGGVKVSPTAVAEVIAEHPAVAEVVVLGVPDEEWGQRVHAFVVARASVPSLDELRSTVAARLGQAAAPRSVSVLAELPMLASGKPDRAALLSLVTG